MNDLTLKRISQFCYLTLVLLIPIWLYFKPNPFSLIWSLLPWWIPLLPAVWGMIKGSDYTMTWANFVLIIPFSHGWMIWLTSITESTWGLVELTLSSTYYLCFLTLSSRIKKRLKAQTQKEELI
ncbi:MAG: hypothetical protein COW84_10320 [Gammaproteobacteria bacterium CG22_combo_CG10-13_8_21_14_all_40_8]|nr:MAG: hypothetical protein COW84_10320 [Gammaproteobacteria bacterium CG22_combo_CG10-13_8_21_14_all_40_8]